MEPPGSDLPPDADQAARLPEELGPLRLTAAVAATVVVAVAHGPGLVLAALLAVVLATGAGVLTTALVAVATATRWGTSWLVAVGGAQAVLGPAGWVGPASAAWSSWLAAAALVLAVPGRSPVGALAVGATAAFVVAGPAGFDGALVRVAATVVAVGLAYGVGRLRWRRAPALAALVLAAAAVGLA